MLDTLASFHDSLHDSGNAPARADDAPRFVRADAKHFRRAPIHRHALPHVGEVLVAAPPGGGPMYLPVETFGRIYMQADNWHTDASGYDLIARAVVDLLK